MTVNIHAAKTRLSELIAKVEKGEQITIARAGKPIARLVRVPHTKRRGLPPDDPLLNLATFAVAGPGRRLTNSDIDRMLYGKP